MGSSTGASRTAAAKRSSQLRLPTASFAVQSANREEWNRSRTMEDADFFTIGYSKRDSIEVIRLLRMAGVATVVDIRHSAVSMFKPEFSKRNLSEWLNSFGIAYIHVPELGVPRDVRARSIHSIDRSELWIWYDEHVSTEFAGVNLHRFFNFADHPVAFMCLETDPCSCHRHRLQIALESHGLRGYDL